MTTVMTSLARNVRSQAAEFQNDTHGTIAVFFGLILIALTAFIGFAIDFGDAFRMRQLMWSAADSASLSAVSSGTAAYNAAVAQIGDGEVPAAERLAEHEFYASMEAQYPGLGRPLATSKVVKTGGSITSTIEFSAQVPSHFLQLLGHQTIPVSGHATAVNGTAAFIDFYLLLDNSPSMGIAATQNDIDTLKAATGGCAFACHETDMAPGTDNYGIAKRLGVSTRIDVLREATQKLMDTAAATATVPDQYQMSIDTFNISTHSITALTPNLARAKADAAAIDLMIVPRQSWNDDRDTNFEVALEDATRKVPASDSGVDAAHTQKVVFFVTDGVADQDLNTVQTIVAGANNIPDNTRIIQVLNSGLCNTMKAKGIKVAVIYTANNPIPGWWQQHVGPFATEINPHLKDCATPGYFFEVAPNQGIDQAMKELFLKAVNDAKISS